MYVTSAVRWPTAQPPAWLPRWSSIASHLHQLDSLRSHALGDPGPVEKYTPPSTHGRKRLARDQPLGREVAQRARVRPVAIDQLAVVAGVPKDVFAVVPTRRPSS